MTRLLTCLLAIASTTLAASAAAKTVGIAGAPRGVVAPGSPYRYTAVTPSPGGAPGRADTTVVVRTDLDGGEVSRWWRLRGPYQVTAISYDGSGSGLSADGGTLVLSRFSWIYPPRTSGFAILDTRRRLRHPLRPGSPAPRHAIVRVGLRGSFTLFGVSPDGETVYLSEHLSPTVGGPARIRALDAEDGGLLPLDAVAAPAGDRDLKGAPVSHVVSGDGRWAYTLFSGYGIGRDKTAQAGRAFVHGLDMATGKTMRAELEGLPRDRDPFELSMRLRRGGRELAVLDRDAALAGSRTLLLVDTRSFEVGEPPAREEPEAGGLPWPAFALALVALGAAIAWRAGRR